MCQGVGPGEVVAVIASATVLQEVDWGSRTVFTSSAESRSLGRSALCRYAVDDTGYKTITFLVSMMICEYTKPSQALRILYLPFPIHNIHQVTYIPAPIAYSLLSKHGPELPRHHGQHGKGSTNHSQSRPGSPLSKVSLPM